MVDELNKIVYQFDIFPEYLSTDEQIFDIPTILSDAACVY